LQRTPGEEYPAVGKRPRRGDGTGLHEKGTPACLDIQGKQSVLAQVVGCQV
jgi:hypothetical protein